MRNHSDLTERAEKISRLMDHGDEIKTEIADRFEDAKNAGYTVSALKAAIKINRMDATKRAKHDDDQQDLLIYLAEIEGRDISEPAKQYAEAAE